MQIIQIIYIHNSILFTNVKGLNANPFEMATNSRRGKQESGETPQAYQSPSWPCDVVVSSAYIEIVDIIISATVSGGGSISGTSIARPSTPSQRMCSSDSSSMRRRCSAIAC